jgi:hypothetical protein
MVNNIKKIIYYRWKLKYHRTIKAVSSNLKRGYRKGKLNDCSNGLEQDTAYRLNGFYLEEDVFYAVIAYKFVKANGLNNIKDNDFF